MFEAVLITLAALCAAYFVVIVLYSGIGTSFAFIWLFFAALCIFLVYGKWYYKRNEDTIPRWVPVSVVTTCAAGAVVLAAICTLVFFGAAGSAQKGLDYVIVLGSRQKEHSQVSSTLKRRLERAIEYAQENPDTVLVLSGGPEQPGEQSEAQVMYNYLLYNGVRPEQMLLEERSSSTVENVAFSRLIIEQDRRQKRLIRERFLAPPLLRGGARVEDKPVEVGILTSNFHVYRAVATAKKWGFANVSGIGAVSDPTLFIHLCVRECASIIKDRIVGNM